MTRRPLVGALAVALLAMGALPAASTPTRGGTRPVTLRASSLFDATHSGWTAIDVPRPVSIEDDPFVGSTQVSITGRADFVALVLREEAASPHVLTFSRFTTCLGGACSARTGVLGNLPDTRRGNSYYDDLPAGRYQAYVLTSGGAVTVRLHLPELARGVARVSPDRPARLSSGHLPGGGPVIPQSLRFSAGNEHTFGPKGGVVLQRLAMVQAQSVAGRTGTCLVPGGPPLGGFYDLTCYPVSGGYSIATVNLPDPHGGTDGFIGAWFDALPEHVAAGVYYDEASPVTGVAAYQSYLDYA